MSRGRAIGTGILIAAVIYFIFVPAFWAFLKPAASAGIAERWNWNEDMPINLAVFAWHSNYVVTGVRFVPDPLQTNLEGITEPLYPMLLSSENAPTRWPRLTLNRLTYPRRRRMTLTVPFGQLAAKGQVGRGVIVGSLDVEIDYVGNVNRRGSIGGEIGRKEVERIPFRIELQ